MEQPKDKYTVVTGNELTLSCRAEAVPGINVDYHWYKCHSDGMQKEPTDYHGNEIALPAIVANQGYYVCGVTPGDSDIIFSSVTHVEVVNSTDITVETGGQPPPDRYVQHNETLVLNFKATCKQYPVRYQWYHNGKELPNHTSSTMTIQSVGDEHMGSYHCEASSDYSAKPVTSETCRVHWS